MPALNRSERQLVRLEKHKAEIAEAITELTGMIAIVRRPATAASV